MEYVINIKELFESLSLGELTAEPIVCLGGHLHAVYKAETRNGAYAVKALNPHVIARPAAYGDYVNSERIAAIASKTVSASAALVFGGSVIQHFAGQSYIIYEWVQGETLRHGETDASKCAKMGEALAKIHSADYSSLGLVDTCGLAKPADWDWYIKAGADASANWASLLSDNIDGIRDYEKRSAEAAIALRGTTLISHRDLEPKNVIWKGSEPVIIDWESAGFINPCHDLAETAIYWAKAKTGDIIEEIFKAFVKAYLSYRELRSPDWHSSLFMGFQPMLGWLEFSIRRALGIESSGEAERAMGGSHIISTIDNLNGYMRMIPKLLEWLTD